MFTALAFIPLIQHAAQLQADLARAALERESSQREREALDRAIYGYGAIDVEARFVDDVPQLVHDSAPCAGHARPDLQGKA